MSVNFEVFGMYSFSVYPVAVLGTAFKNVKILGVVSQATAEALGFDTRAAHALVKTSLPATVPDDPSRYLYLQIQTPAGLKQFIGLPWIIEDSVEIVNLGKFTLEIDNESSSQQQRILDCLAANGIRVSKIGFSSAS